MNDLRSHKRRSILDRGAATLIELLVVLVIFSLLAASAIPMLSPIMSNRQMREGARVVSSALTGARNRAMQSGRPYAVVLDRVPGLPEACASIAYAEVPPPYAGDTLSSNVTVASSPVGGSISYFVTGLTTAVISGTTQSTDIGWFGTVRVGDLIRFNNQGPYFQFIPNVLAATNNSAQAYDVTTGYYNVDPALAASAAGYWQISSPPGANATPPVGTFRYQIIRAPVRSAAGAVSLPGSTVIDLNFSGFDLTNSQTTQENGLLSPYGYSYSFQPIWPRPGRDPTSYPSADCPLHNTTLSQNMNDTSSIVIMFAPSGAIDTVWCWDNSSDAAQGTLTVQTPSSTTTVSSYSIPIPYKPLTPIHLLIGRRELVPLPTTATPPHIISPTNGSTPYDPNDSNFKPYLNWQDMGCLWVSIDHKSGMVSTAENNASATAFNNGGYGVANGTPGYGSYVELMESRQLAIELQRIGGR